MYDHNSTVHCQFSSSIYVHRVMGTSVLGATHRPVCCNTIVKHNIFIQYEHAHTSTVFLSSTRLHAQYNVYYRALSECAPLCKMVHGKISIGGFTAQSTRSSVAQICNLQTPKKPLSLPATCLYLSSTNSFSLSLASEIDGSRLVVYDGIRQGWW